MFDTFGLATLNSASVTNNTTIGGTLGVTDLSTELWKKLIKQLKSEEKETIRTLIIKIEIL